MFALLGFTIRPLNTFISGIRGSSAYSSTSFLVMCTRAWCGATSSASSRLTMGSSNIAFLTSCTAKNIAFAKHGRWPIGACSGSRSMTSAVGQSFGNSL